MAAEVPANALNNTMWLHTLFAFEEETAGEDKDLRVRGRLQKKDSLRHTGKLKMAGIGG